jgi:ElaB/YqjD/DUF883 family membrane-anchored ribosome-binding protein
MATDSTNFPTLSDRPSMPTDTPAAGVSGTGTGTATSGDDLMRRVVQGAHSTIDRLAETAAPAVSRLQEGVHAAGDKLHTGADHARELGDEWAESLRSTVREHPIASVAVALAAGMLISRLTASR